MRFCDLTVLFPLDCVLMQKQRAVIMLDLVGSGLRIFEVILDEFKVNHEVEIVQRDRPGRRCPVPQFYVHRDHLNAAEVTKASEMRAFAETWAKSKGYASHAEYLKSGAPGCAGPKLKRNLAPTIAHTEIESEGQRK